MAENDKKEEKKEETKEKRFEKVVPEKEENKKQATQKQTNKKANQKVKTKEKGRKRAMLVRIIAVAIVLIVIIALIYVIMPSPARTLQEMLKSLKIGDFEKANEYVNYEELSDMPILSFENEEEKKDVQKLFFEELQFNIKKVKKEENTATVEIDITNKNFKTILQNYTKKVMQSIFNNEDINTDDVLIQELQNKEIDKVTSRQTITIQKQDGKWEVLVDDNLKNALFPGLSETLDGITSGNELS